jgi:hypothetical protein
MYSGIIHSGVMKTNLWIPTNCYFCVQGCTAAAADVGYLPFHFPKYTKTNLKFPLQRESNPLFRAVLSSNLKDLMNLVESGSPINIQNEKGSSLLNFTMRRKR